MQPMPDQRTPTDASPRRLALVITELDPGGAERCLVDIATRIDSDRFTPVVYSLAPPPQPAKQRLVARLQKAGIATHFLGFTKPWHYLQAVRRLAELLRQQQAHISQTFLFHANIVGTQAARSAGVRHIVSGIRVADPRRWRTQLERIATASAERHVCVSQSVAEFCKRRGFAAEKLVVIPNGIDVSRWQNATPADASRWGVPRGRKVLLYVGRLDPQKGLDALFRQLPRVFRELTDHDLLLVGEGALRSKLETLAAALAIGDRVHFAGWQDETPRIFAVADIVLLPSRWEGMPNAILEAMASGKPVIATQAEGTVELLGLGAPEQTVPVGDWDAFGRLVIGVARDQQLAKELGRKNRARAQQFSIEIAVQRYERLYASLVR
jgi:glycosyltransferase involved in cell wall biosynthesis